MRRGTRRSGSGSRSCSAGTGGQGSAGCGSGSAAGTAAGASPIEHTIEEGPYKGTLTIKLVKMADYAEELAKKKQVQLFNTIA